MTKFSPGTRRYPVLPEALRCQLDRIEPATDGVVRYFPCKVRLTDESWQDYVFLVESSEYIQIWGVWPNQDAGKREIRLENVVEIQESASRLPRPLAQILYDAGESGMGYLLFGISLNGERIRPEQLLRFFFYGDDGARWHQFQRL